MVKRYKTMNVKPFIHKNFDLIEKIYRRHHPEMIGIYISKQKLLLEMQKFYAQRQRELKEMVFDEE